MIYFMLMFVFIAFGVRVATYAKRNLPSPSAVQCVSMVKSQEEAPVQKELRNPLKSLKLSVLHFVELSPFAAEPTKSLNLISESIQSVELHALRRPPRA